MHKHLLKIATDEQVRDFADDAMSMLKETNPQTYEDLEMHLYKEIYGCHFDDFMLNKAVNSMENKDGTRGGHWSVEQTTSVAKQNGIAFTKFNEYDWNYVMNMFYSDFYGVITNDVSFYVKMSAAFLEDKDAPEGKALRYYLAMSN